MFDYYLTRMVSAVVCKLPKDVKGSSLAFFFKHVTGLAPFFVPGWVSLGRRWLFIGVGAAERIIRRLLRIGT